MTPPPALPVITGPGDFWNVPEAEKQKVHPLRVEMVVYYYDTSWRLLWGDVHGARAFWPMRGMPMHMRSGQRVLIEGTVVPAYGLAGDEVKVTVLDEDAMPAPVPTRGILDDVQQLDASWAQLEGYVVRQADGDSTHIELDVLSDGHVVTLRVQVGSTEPIPQLLNARVRANFVYTPDRDSQGRTTSLHGWVPRRSDVTVLGWMETDPLFERAPVPIESIATASKDAPVHIVGAVQNYEPARSILLRDSSGEVLIRTQQKIQFNSGDRIEAIGYKTGSGIDVTLSDPCCRVVSDGGVGTRAENPADGVPALRLRLVEQIMDLRPEMLSRRPNVSLRGVVTWSSPGASFYFVQDRSGGVRVRVDDVSGLPPPAGTVVAVDGVAVNGTHAPEVQLKRANVLVPTDLPPGHPITLEDALAGSEEANFVEMRGYIRAIEQTGPWTQLDLTAATGEFTACMPAATVPDALIGAFVRVTGVCTAVTRAERQLTGVRLWVVDQRAVHVDLPRAADPFAATPRSIAGLRQSLSFRSVERPVRVSGAVVYDRPGRYMYLQDGDAALLVLRRDQSQVQPGEWLEVVGLPGRDGNRLVLREAQWRRTAAHAAFSALKLGSAAALHPDADGRLVTVVGRLIEKHDEGRGVRLGMRTDTVGFEARLEGAQAEALPHEGGLLELTGAYAVEFDEYHRPRGFHIDLRSVGDVVVIEAASWWTIPRALTIAGGFALCAALGIAWVAVLRRKVNQQTTQIRAQLEKHARLDADIERAARLESLGVLAGGIAHDFNNLLTVIIANLGIAAMDQRVREAAGDIIADAERGAHRAAELTQQLLTFAKGGDPVRRAVALPDIVRESAEFARHGSHVRCLVEVEPDLPPANVDRAQISRVVHNLVLNATQAMPEGGVVRLHLTSVVVNRDEEPNLAPGRYVKLSVSDEGQGIAPENVKRIFEPYFSTKPKNNGLGLATVHSIVKRHQGHIGVRSELGIGTIFDVWLPVATETAQPVAVAQAPRQTSAKLRVLFMDDDEIIRRTAAVIFQQLGHNAKIVGDGMEVVREYELALNSGRKYDVVVLDLTVPGGLGGRAAMEILRRIDPSVRGIVSSGYSNDPVMANHRAYGFCAVVPKPYIVEDLARAIQEVAVMKDLPSSVRGAVV